MTHEEATERIKCILKNNSFTRADKNALKLAIEALEKQATVDAVEVVRCKYCAVPHNKYTGCPKLNGLVTPPDFYCPFGERK